MSVLLRLQDWFQRQCDGEWEHHFGVTIQSCDNPGWWITIDLKGTTLEGVEFPEIRENIDANGHPDGDRWLRCYLSADIWNGAGDPTRLEDILEQFLCWAEAQGG